jgi:hypothetical protein
MRSKSDIGFRAPLPDAGDLSQRIIENYRLNAQPVRRDYLEYLAQKSLCYADELDQKKNNQAPAYNVEQNTKAVVDRIYSILEVYALELNKVSRARDLFISATEPSHLNEVLEFDRARQPLKSLAVYRARFSTNRLSLVVRGLGNLVEFFLLPGDRVMGLSRAEAEVNALMVFQSEQAMAGPAWFVEAKPLTADRLERYSLLALEHLLDKTREEVS